MTDLSGKEKFRVLLQNEESFDLLFCDLRKFPEHLSLYFNKDFEEDPVFNHFIFDESLLVRSESVGAELDAVFARALSEENQRRLRLSFFMEDFWDRRQEIEKAGVDAGYIILDNMEILSKPVGNATREAYADSDVRAFLSEDYELWNDLFIQSFGIPLSWKEELLRRERKAVENPDAFFIIAEMIGNEAKPAGCLLGYRMPDECMGIYCVGTINEFRGRGVARSMLDFAEELAQSKACKVLTLQTLSSDHVSPMYKKLGYKTDFQRDILMRPA